VAVEYTLLAAMQYVHANASGHRNHLKKQNTNSNSFKCCSRKRNVEGASKPHSRCDDCDVPLNSVITAEMHFKGKKHAHIIALKRKWSLSDNAVVDDTSKEKNFDEKTENCPSASTATTVLSNTNSAVSGKNGTQYQDLNKSKCTSDGEIMKVKHSKATVLCNSKPLSACFVNATYKDRFTLTSLPKRMSLASRDCDYGRKDDLSESSDLHVENSSAIESNSLDVNEKN